jgi:acetolactate synthase-1/2/3 large subunit
MGYSPAATGVAVAAGKPVYCITGDGSFQFNIQELQTVKHAKLPIRFIMLSNNGYLLIRHTQKNFQGGRYMGTHEETGVSFPDMELICKAYGIGYVRIESEAELEAKLDHVMASEGPVLCEVLTPPDQLLQPRVAAKALEDGTMVSMPYDHMFPFLDMDEYEQNQVYDKF